MHLSKAYSGRVMWAIAYETGHNDSNEIELVNDFFFSTEKEAWDYFHRKYFMDSFINAKAVKFVMDIKLVD